MTSNQPTQMLPSVEVSGGLIPTSPSTSNPRREGHSASETSASSPMTQSAPECHVSPTAPCASSPLQEETGPPSTPGNVVHQLDYGTGTAMEPEETENAKPTPTSGGTLPLGKECSPVSPHRLSIAQGTSTLPQQEETTVSSLTPGNVTIQVDDGTCGAKETTAATDCGVLEETENAKPTPIAAKSAASGQVAAPKPTNQYVLGSISSPPWGLVKTKSRGNEGAGTNSNTGQSVKTKSRLETESFSHSMSIGRRSRNSTVTPSAGVVDRPHFPPRSLHSKATNAAMQAKECSKDKGQGCIAQLWEANKAYVSTMWGGDSAANYTPMNPKMGLNKFPVLKFADKAVENRYKRYVEGIMLFRVLVGTVILLIILIIQWAFSATTSDDFPNVPASLAKKLEWAIMLGHIFHGIQIALVLATALQSAMYCFRKYLESFIVKIFCLSSLLATGKCFVWWKAIDGTANVIVVSRIGSFVRLEMVVWFVAILLIVNLLLPIRMQRSIFCSILCLICGTSVYVLLKVTTAFAGTTDLLLLVAVVFVTCVISRYENEKNHRYVWIGWMESEERVQKLEEHFLRPRSSPTAGVETVLTYLRNVEDIVLHGKMTGGVSKWDLEKVERFLLPCIELLVESKDLYKVKPEDMANAFSRDFIVLFGNEKPGDSESSGIRDQASRERRATRVARLRSSRMSEDLKLPTSIGTDWSFDMKELTAASEPPLVSIGYALLIPFSNSKEVPFSSEFLKRFLYNIDKQYKVNPYHNALHGSQVAHFTVCLANMLQIRQYMSDLDEVSLILSALCHDVGHPGRNNNFLVATKHHLAICYNDCSVLENYHASCTFRTLQIDGCNILAGTSDIKFREKRSTIIDLILATDMKRHFDEISIFRARRQSPEFNYSERSEDLWKVATMCIKAADIGHAAMDWEMHYQWSLRVSEEFYQQGEEEERLGLKKSFLCDRSKMDELPKSQNGFLSYVAMPLFDELAAIDSEDGKIGTTCMVQLRENAEQWLILHEQQCSSQPPKTDLPDQETEE